MKRARSGVAGRGAVWLSVWVCLAGGSVGCHKGSDPIGPPDSYLLFVPALTKDGQVRRGPTGSPALEPLALDDSRAVPYHKLFSVGFAAELLRTDYLRKQFVRDAQVDGKPFAPDARAAASEPTVFVLAGDPPFVPPGVGRGLATLGFFGGAVERADAGWIAVPPSPDSDTALAQTLSFQLGRAVAAGIAIAGPTPGPATALAPVVLIDGYAEAMEVIAREWRTGEGPRGTLPPDAGTLAQRELFAAVRQNRFVTTTGVGRPQLRSAAEMLADPGVAATVIYRMAQSKSVGRHVAPAEIYAPFVSERVPTGVSPAAVLGPFRNFQAKLITSWERATLRGHPPRDIVDLVEAYAATVPAERAEVVRLFVVTTYGATVKPGGVSGGADSTASLAELTALAAEVAAGRRPLRAPVNVDK